MYTYTSCTIIFTTNHIWTNGDHGIIIPILSAVCTVHIYIYYVYMHIYMYVYMYMYIYIEREREGGKEMQLQLLFPIMMIHDDYKLL